MCIRTRRGQKADPRAGSGVCLSKGGGGGGTLPGDAHPGIRPDGILKEESGAGSQGGWGAREL